MAKKSAFDVFREATLSEGTATLRMAVESKAPATPATESAPKEPSPVASSPAEKTSQTKVSKNEGRELVSFHIDKELKRALGFVKFNTNKSYNDLYIEAVTDLIEKYKEYTK